MWRCEACSKEFDDKTTAVEVRFGYVDSEEAVKSKDQYMAFNTENAWAPLCNECAMDFIKGEI
jgi:hypothetical protein